MKASRISRIVRILTILQSGRKYSPDELAKLLGVSRRTFFRDIKELTAVGVPYFYDSKKGGYGIRGDFFLPPVDFTLREALSLLLLIHKGRHTLQVPFRKSALMGAIKIESNLPAGIKDYCSATLENISVKPGAQAPMEELERVFSSLQFSVRRFRKVKIFYHSLFEGADIDVILEPYHLLYNQRAWYVIGYSSFHKSVRTFKLNRIKDFKILEKGFVKDGKFDLKEYLGKAWSMIPEGKLYSVRLRFSPKVATNVAEVRWHCTQQVSFNPDGSADVEFRVDGLGEIYWWVLGYGDQVEVLAPACLRKRIADTAGRLETLNG